MYSRRNARLEEMRLHDNEQSSLGAVLFSKSDRGFSCWSSSHIPGHVFAQESVLELQHAISETRLSARADVWFNEQNLVFRSRKISTTVRQATPLADGASTVLLKPSLYDKARAVSSIPFCLCLTGSGSRSACQRTRTSYPDACSAR